MESFEDALPHVSPVWTRYTSILVERGEGCFLFDVNGTAYLDFTCGIGVTNTGHCHPKVVEAIQKQASLLIHGQANIVLNRPMLELISELRSIVPKEIDGFFFSNSGAEAVEGAMKLARQATHRPNIIVFQGSFHGRTIGTMSLTTSKTIYRIGYQPLMPGVIVAPYPYTHRYGWSEEYTSHWCIEELELLLRTQTAPEETAAILVEPVLGEGGYVVPPMNFMKYLRRLCDQHEILLIADEIQSGMGRTGTWFAFEHFGIIPDILVVAKGLASGLPISGVFSRMDIMRKWLPGSHGGTFGGNAIAAAAGIATIRAIRDEKMLINARQRGDQLKEGLLELQRRFPEISDVRGLGLMVGTEFRNPQTREPTKDIAKEIIHACLNRKLLLLSCGPWDNTIRWIPPLVVTKEQVDQALDIFEQSLVEVLRNKS